MFRDIQQFLRRTLIGNAVFSTASALVCIAAAPGLATQIAMAPKQFVALGVQLLVFAAILAFLGTRSRLDHGGVLSAVIFFGLADLLWVVGSAKGLQAGVALTALGQFLVLGVAVVVGVFGVLELVGAIALMRQRRAVATA